MVEDAQQIPHVTLLDALDMMKDSRAHEPEKEQESDDAAIARQNEASLRELEEAMKGVKFA